jgi:hypothetical protein
LICAVHLEQVERIEDYIPLTAPRVLVAQLERTILRARGRLAGQLAQCSGEAGTSQPEQAGKIRRQQLHQ